MFLITFVNFSVREYKLERQFCTIKPILNVRFKDFLYTKINLTQIWYDEIN